MVTWTQRPQFSPLSNMPISLASAAGIGRGRLVYTPGEFCTLSARKFWLSRSACGSPQPP